MRTSFPPFRLAALAAGLLSCCLLDAPAFAQLRISEFMASNVSVTQDEDAAFSDWIEIHNAGASDVNLEGWHLTDTPTNLSRWTFPATNLPAEGFLLVFASGKDRTSPRLHANFSLSADGEYLALVHPDGTTIEHAYAPYPPQFPDISYGLQTHGPNPTLRAGRAGYLIRHTPGAPNPGFPSPHPAYGDESVARIDLELSQDTWNWLMRDSPDTSSTRPASVRFRHGDIDVTVTNVGIQCRGNTSLTKHPRSFNIAFDAFVPDQTLLGLERLNLNGDVNDPSMARPKLLNDLAGALGMPVSLGNHVALVVSNSTSGDVFFDAVRNNTEAVDDTFLERRFGNKRGNLYKCNSRQWQATLDKRLPSVGASYIGDGSTYELKYAGAGDKSYADLASFINLIHDTASSNFPNAIMNAFDVDGFLRHMAFDVLTGNWDDYWINANNYHLFLHPDSRRWVYIPYDFDNAMGIRWLDADWANVNIYSWPDLHVGSSSAPLATKILAVNEFSNRYSFYMKQMLDSVYSPSVLEPALFHIRSSMIGALPFDSGSITNMKEDERQRYGDSAIYNWFDYAKWTYDHFFWSYVDAQGPYVDGKVPNDYGITQFISTRRASALAQLKVRNIAPILSAFSLSPARPGATDSFCVSVRAIDDVAVSNVTFLCSFNGGATNEIPMDLQPGGLYAATVPAMGATGTLRYLVRALDNTSRATTHPYGGTPYAATLAVGAPAASLVVTELNYNPYDLSAAESTAGATDAQNLEFIELFNAGDAPLDLTGCKFAEGVGGTLPAFILTNGHRAVVVKNTAQFRIRYPDSAIRIIGTFSGNLSNGGETIRLENASGGVIASIPYGDKDDWPGRADGDGSSLELVDPVHPDYANPFAWRSSSEYGGSPGAAGLGPDERVVVNEVLTHTDPPLSDSIELLNVTEGALDIGGWFLSDAKSNYRKYAIPAGTVLPAGGYIVFNETNHFNASGTTNGFSLDGAHGDDVYLLQADAQGRLLRFANHVEFGAAANGESFGRWPNGSGAGFPMLSRTFGAANSGPRVGPVVIREIMYNPPSGSNHLEFIEIENPTDSTVDLSRWQLDDGIAFPFPNGTTLPAGGTLAVLSFDPGAASNSAWLADFLATYALTNDATLIGGFSGSLSDAGERVRLLRPDEPPAEEPAYYPMLIEDEVGYGADLPWPPEANGGGFSLERLAPAAWGDSYTSWAAISPPTPGEKSPPPPTFSLTVASDHGNPLPPVGTHGIAAHSFLSNSVPSPVVSGGFKYSCTGWTLSEHEPASGATNWMTMALTNDASLEWLWSTNCRLSVSSSPGGAVQPASGWRDIGETVDLEAAASNFFAFAEWTGDTHAIVSGSPTSAAISVRMDAPVSLTARFEGLPVPSNTLTVVSSHGAPIPSVGAHSFATGSVLANSVDSLVLSGDSVFACTGWILAGHEPASGATNRMTMTLTNDATLVWNWSTNFALFLSADPGGHLLHPGEAWHPSGSIVELQAVASNLFAFAGWTGDTSAIVSGDASTPSISVRMDATVSLHAAFGPVAATFYVSPSGSHTPPYTNWTLASTSLHAVVAYVPPASTVLVAAATYALPGQLSLDKPIHLIGADGPAATVLDGRDSFRVLFLSHSNAIAEGFTIQNGYSGGYSGGGVRIEPAGRLARCILRDNTTGKSGGGAALVGGGEILNCLFFSNDAPAERGGALYTYSDDTPPLVDSCTFSRNSANEGGGAYLLNAATLRNSILWGNAATTGSNLVLAGSAQILESTLANTSPLFIDPAGLNFRLALGSPARDVGTLQPWMPGAADLDGRPRVLYGTNDLGAYENLLETVDSDGDRIGDWQESLAGTDPFDPGSFLGIASAALDPDPGQFVLSWSSAAGRSYRIARRTNLIEGVFSAAYTNIPADPPLNTFTGAFDHVSPAFYRIELE